MASGFVFAVKYEGVCTWAPTERSASPPSPPARCSLTFFFSANFAEPSRLEDPRDRRRDRLKIADLLKFSFPPAGFWL